MSQFIHKYDRTVFGGAEILSSIGSSTANAWWGRLAVTSQSNVVSTAIVASNSIIQFTLQSNVSVTSAGADVAVFGVTSISPGNFFLLGTVASVAIVGSFTAMWTLFNPTP